MLKASSGNRLVFVYVQMSKAEALWRINAS